MILRSLSSFIWCHVIKNACGSLLNVDDPATETGLSTRRANQTKEANIAVCGCLFHRGFGHPKTVHIKHAQSHLQIHLMSRETLGSMQKNTPTSNNAHPSKGNWFPRGREGEGRPEKLPLRRANAEERGSPADVRVVLELAGSRSPAVDPGAWWPETTRGRCELRRHR
jgi:hypothetical protein